MITLIGSLIGFLSSSLPDLLQIWRDSADRRHELEVLDRQIEQQKLGHRDRLEEIEVLADVTERAALYKYDAAPTGVLWIDALRGSVRPIITYCFFCLFAGVKIASLYLLVVDEHLTIAHALPQIWDSETQALFSAVVSFWFGHRAHRAYRASRGG